MRRGSGELRTAALYHLSRALAGAQGVAPVLAASATELEKVFSADVMVFLPASGGGLERRHASAHAAGDTERDASIAHWVWSHQKPAGLGTSTLPSTGTLFVPLLASGGIAGVLGLTPQQRERFEALDERRQLEAFAAQVALAIERAVLAEETEKARREVEAEQLRSALLSSVSHDLRTPLAIITGAASTLLERPMSIDAGTQRDLTRTILDEAERLERLIRNLLDMTRLEAGAVNVRKEWTPLEEVVGAALTRLESRLGERVVNLYLPRDLPLAPFDSVLLEQVFVNLLENAAKYTTGPIDIGARLGEGELLVEVADRGPGIPAGDEARIFEKFQRGGREGVTGVGLGLTICRAIVAAHGGRIWARNRDGGGAIFSFTLPIPGVPPDLPPERALHETTS